MRRTHASGVLVAASCLALLWAANASAEEPKLDELAAGRGEVVFARYCATCHGRAGDGTGVLAKELRTSVPDLRNLALKNGGKFPFEKVVKAIDGRQTVRAHGSADMPAWGDALQRTEGRGADTVEQALANLAHHIWSLQKQTK